MERVPSYVEARRFRIGDLYALGEKSGSRSKRIESLFFRRGVGDQRNRDVEADERHGAPVLGDEAEHAMLDLVALGSARRIVANLNDQAGFVGELLQRRHDVIRRGMGMMRSPLLERKARLKALFAD